MKVDRDQRCLILFQTSLKSGHLYYKQAVLISIIAKIVTSKDLQLLLVKGKVNLAQTFTYLLMLIDLHPCQTCGWSSKGQVSIPVLAPHSNPHSQETSVGNHVDPVHHTSQPNLVN